MSKLSAASAVNCSCSVEPTRGDRHFPKVRKSRREFLSFIYHSRDLSIIFQASVVHLYCEVMAANAIDKIK
ncbi:hypothetical protein [Dendronalium sp. ChiSLP03b]|uniref:hypothetical protein n=1 Tax=Dendronalium sp. ChiSLP03b TaxID=3075381 RepID=UPI002AD34738|nr:hypothetical protein [Dendronalium sp. ChiSLP03b]MDZ8208617.1 hypothetical protein [Dendronalium sp. ChiSLP03b]